MPQSTRDSASVSNRSGSRAAWWLPGLALAPALAVAQGMAGAYAGTIDVTYSEGNRLSRTTLRGMVQIRLPLTRSDADFDGADTDHPGAKARMKLTQMEFVETSGSPDSAGRIYTDTCTLPAPVEVPLAMLGGLGVDKKKKTYIMNILLSSPDEVTLNCTHSVTGPHKRRRGVQVNVGTNEAGTLYAGLPFIDAAHLAATHSMVPGPGMASHNMKIEQKWDLRLER